MKRFFFYLFCIAALAGCASHKEVHTSEHNNNHYEHSASVDSVFLRDSIYVHDSVFSVIREKGDTVFVLKEKYQIVYRDRATGAVKRDTVIVTDTIADTVYTERIVKQQPSFFSQLRLMATGVALGAVLAALLFIYVNHKE